MIADDVLARLARGRNTLLKRWIDGDDDTIEISRGLGAFATLPVADIHNERARFEILFGSRVRFEERPVRHMGIRTQMPVKVTFDGPGDVLACVLGDDWTRIRGRFERLHRTIGRLDALASIAARIAGLADTDFEGLATFAEWRRAHPVDRPYVRSIGLIGVEGKWVERNIRLCRLACRDLGCEVDVDEDIDACGLTREDRREVHLRWSEDTFTSPFGNTSMSVRISEIAGSRALAEKIAVVLVVENLEMVEKLRPAPDVLIVFGGGHAVGPVLADLSCLRAAKLVYWGDADSHGFACLAEARRARPDILSHRMDPAILDDASELMTSEPEASRLAEVPDGLTDAEAACCRALKAPWRRLEQERDIVGMMDLSARGLVDPDIPLPAPRAVAGAARANTTLPV